MKLSTMGEILDFAKAREKDAVVFYRTCEEKAGRPAMKAAFREMAEEESRHVKFLEQIDPASFASDTVDMVNDPRMEMYIVEKPFHPQMSFQELLQLAIHREAASYHLYLSLKEKTADSKVVQLLDVLAGEELKHKERLEAEYDRDVLQEN